MEEKKWWQSSSVWAALIAIVAPALNLSTDDQASLANYLLAGAGAIAGIVMIIKRIWPALMPKKPIAKKLL